MYEEGFGKLVHEASVGGRLTKECGVTCNTTDARASLATAAKIKLREQWSEGEREIEVVQQWNIRRDVRCRHTRHSCFGPVCG